VALSHSQVKVCSTRHKGSEVGLPSLLTGRFARGSLEFRPRTASQGRTFEKIFALCVASFAPHARVEPIWLTPGPRAEKPHFAFSTSLSPPGPQGTEPWSDAERESKGRLQAGTRTAELSNPNARTVLRQTRTPACDGWQGEGVVIGPTVSCKDTQAALPGELWPRRVEDGLSPCPLAGPRPALPSPTWHA
jgi:hypothetical protein